jgi:hypothetical protein
MPQISTAVQQLISMVTAGATTSEDEIRKLARQVSCWNNDTALTTTTAATEQVAIRARQKCRFVAANFLAQAAVTGAATNFFTLLVAKRPAAAPATPVNLITYAADTATTDDAVAYGSKNLLASATYTTYVPTALSSDFDMLEGDVLTVAVTKAGTGMTFPIAGLSLELEPRT